MPLQLILGPANASKAGLILNSFRENAERGEAPVLVVPTAADRDAYERELLSGGSLIGGRVVTWERFVRDLARKGSVAGRVIGPLRRRLIVRELVSAALDAGQLKSLERSARAPGFPLALERLILEHSRGLMLESSLLEMPVGGSKARASETLGLLNAYFDRLDADGLLDRDLQARRSLDALRAEPGLWLGEPVLFYGFSDLTAVQAEVVKALAAAASVTVSLSTDKTGRVGVADIVAQRLRAAADSGVQVTEEEVVPEADPDGSPASLGASLFTPAKSGSVHDDGRVRILSGSGSRAAAELAAGAVVDLIDKGTAPDLIAIVRPNADDDALLESILRSAG
ncbi:MAG: hypothetical protein WCJ63_07120, partial [Actinomycetes bacterium]